MNYWHMQMHQDHNDKSALINVCEILEKKRIVGLGKWHKGKSQINSFCNDMKVNDIVAIKAGARFIALVQVIGGDYEVRDDEDDMTYWIAYRRPIRVLDWEIDGNKLRKCPQARGTLNICKDDNAETSKVIKSWHKCVVASFKKRGINLTV